jgi:hypothetical protein
VITPGPRAESRRLSQPIGRRVLAERSGGRSITGRSVLSAHTLADLAPVESRLMDRHCLLGPPSSARHSGQEQDEEQDRALRKASPGRPSFCGPLEIPTAPTVARRTRAGSELAFPLMGAQRRLFTETTCTDALRNASPLERAGSMRISASIFRRITPSGPFSHLATPPQSSYATNLTAGANGSVWFAEMEPRAICRMSPSQLITSSVTPL